ncbi:hypothetical protein GCM10027589_15110 [Actinocorallia lasiicapitis]
MLDAIAQVRERSLSESLTIGFTVLALVVTVLAVFADYAEATTSMPAVTIVVMSLNEMLIALIAACLMPFRSLFPLGAALIVTFGPLRALDAAGPIEKVLRGRADVTPSFGLSLIVAVLVSCAAATAITALRGRGELRCRRRGVFLWGMIGSVLVTVELIGLWMPWLRSTVEWTRNGRRVTSVKECCALFSDDTPLSRSVMTVVGAVVAAAFLAVAFRLLSRLTAAGLIIGIGGSYLIDLINATVIWLSARSGQERGQAFLNASPEKIAKYQPHLEFAPLPGLWISAAGVLLIILTVFTPTLTRPNTDPDLDARRDADPPAAPYPVERPRPDVEIISSPRRW